MNLRRRLLRIAVMGLMLGIGGVGIVSWGIFSQKNQSFSPENMLQFMQKKKVDVFTEIRDHLPSILAQGGVKGATQLVEKAFIQSAISLNDCHSLLHRIGHEAYEREKDNLDRLVSITHACQDSIQHGVEAQIVLTHQNSSEIHAKLIQYCEEFHKFFPTNTCYHGAGHGFFQRYRIAHQALEQCDALRTDERTDLNDCYRGVFSEYANQVLGVDTDTGLPIPVSIPLVADREKPLRTCEAIDFLYRDACYSQFAKMNFYQGAFKESIEACLQPEYSLTAQKICVRIVSALEAEHVLSKSDTLAVPEFIHALEEQFRKEYIDGIRLAFISFYTSGIERQWKSVCESFSELSERQYCRETLNVGDDGQAS